MLFLSFEALRGTNFLNTSHPLYAHVIYSIRNGSFDNSIPDSSKLYRPQNKNIGKCGKIPDVSDSLITLLKLPGYISYLYDAAVRHKSDDNCQMTTEA